MPWSNDSHAYGPGRLGAIGAMTDDDLRQRLQSYKRQVAKRYRVVPSELCAERLPEGPLRVSAKLDGQLWFLVQRDGRRALCAANGRVLEDLPLLTQLGAGLGNADLLIAGELTAVPPEGRPRVQHVSAALGDGDRAGELRFTAFDLIEDDATDALARPYAERLDRLHELLGEEQVVPTSVVERQEVPRLYQDWVASGRHEGLVARSERGFIYKIKPVIDLDLVVVAFGARIIGERHELRELSVALIDEAGAYQLVGSVGSGLGETERRAWYERLQASIVASDYRLANSAGTLCHFVRPEIVVQVQCADLLIGDGDGRPIRRMRLDWDGERYRPLGEYPTAVMLHPRFERERTDKLPTAADVGLEQLLSRVSLEVDDPAASIDLPTADILDRGVWVKETKGRKAVRKYLLIKTNKEALVDCSAYVVFSTDYSPGRAEALKTSLQLAADRTSAEDQVAAWKDANIKRGWQAV